MSTVESSTNNHYIKVPVKDGETADKEEKTLEEDVPDKYGYGVRHIQSVIFFLCITTSFIARGHLAVTIVAMTVNDTLNAEDDITINISKENDTHVTNTTENIALPKGIYTNNKTYDLYNDLTTEVMHTDNVFDGTENSWTIYRTYNWSKPIQEMILTSFFFGYCLMLLPISMVCQRWGGKVPLQFSMFINAALSIITPWMALWGGWKAVCVCRVAQGLSQAGTYPSIQTLLAKWVPSTEKATMSSYVYAGAAMGNIVGFQLSGIVCHAFGWPATFWATGFLCFITGAILTVFAAKSPAVHNTISNKEKTYIMRQNEASVAQKNRTPWRAILTSKPAWANFVTHVGSGLSFIFFLNQIPTYIHYIFGVNVKNSGILTSVPYIASLFCSIGLGIISDFLTNRKIISIKNARRISNSIAQVGVAASLIGASYTSSVTVAIICFVICKCFEIGIHTGWMINHIDLSPNYSGTLMAIGSTLLNICVVVFPVLVSNIVIDMTNVYQWRIMIYIVAAIAFVPNLIFVIFMSTDVQPWNNGNCTEVEEKDVQLESLKEKEDAKL